MFEKGHSYSVKEIQRGVDLFVVLGGQFMRGNGQSMVAKDTRRVAAVLLA